MSDPSSAESKLPGWIADHLRRYRETNGADGHLWNGVPTLLLTTTGRRTGRALTLPLIYGEDAGRYVLVASKGGAPENPLWYENLKAQADVDVQVKADRFRARARDASPAERPALWRTMTKLWPAYDEYQAKTSREIPIVVLERR